MTSKKPGPFVSLSLSVTALALLLLGLPAAGASALPELITPSPRELAAAAATCKGNEQCGEGEFCAKLFGRCADAGKCEERPKDCIEHGGKVLVRVVCGCDDKTYDSVCVAAIAGVSVAHEGACAPK